MVQLHCYQYFAVVAFCQSNAEPSSLAGRIAFDKPPLNIYIRHINILPWRFLYKNRHEDVPSPISVAVHGFLVRRYAFLDGRSWTNYSLHFLKEYQKSKTCGMTCQIVQYLLDRKDKLLLL